MNRLTDDALAHLHNLILERIKVISGHIAGNACKDFSEYKYMTGKISGLEEAERELIELQQRLLDE
jgi:hypothetical protein